MPCAPEFSYLESASAEAGTCMSPLNTPDALPSLATRHEGFFVALAHAPGSDPGDPRSS